MSKKKTKKSRIDTFEQLEKFVKAVRKKYGKKADAMRVEVQRPFTMDNETYYSPHEMSYMGVVRKAKKLHKNKTTPEVLRTIVARMSSEIAGLTMAHYSYVQNITGLGRLITKEFDLKETE